MKRTLVFLGLVFFVGYVAVSTACWTSGSVAGGNPPIDCPDGMEPHRASRQYHGWEFETRGGCECASGLCLDFSGDIMAYNRDIASHNHCPDFFAGIPNFRHSLCTADGWVTLWWDGNPKWVCVEWEPE